MFQDAIIVQSYTGVTWPFSIHPLVRISHRWSWTSICHLFAFFSVISISWTFSTWLERTLDVFEEDITRTSAIPDYTSTPRSIAIITTEKIASYILQVNESRKNLDLNKVPSSLKDSWLWFFKLCITLFYIFCNSR